MTVEITPTISAVVPSLGDTAGGTAIEVLGAGFVAGTTVTIGGSCGHRGCGQQCGARFRAVTPAGMEGPADVVVTNANGSATLAGGFTYVAPGSELLADDFDDGDAAGWTISPLGHEAGWSVVNGVYTYDGSGHTQAYAARAAGGITASRPPSGCRR